MAEGGARKKGKGFSHVTSPWTPLISELARSSGRLVAIKDRSDEASSFLGALLWHACTAAGPTCTCVRLTLLKERSRVDPVQFGIRAASGGLRTSEHFPSLSPFSCLLPVTRPLWDELRVMPPPTHTHCPLVCPPTSIRTHGPTNPPPLRLHLNDSTINILQTNTRGGKLQRN